jgi:hypothetical protein
VLQILGKPESLVAPVADRPGHDRRYSLDTTKLRALGWSPSVPFDKGCGRPSTGIEESWLVAAHQERKRRVPSLPRTTLRAMELTRVRHEYETSMVVRGRRGTVQSRASPSLRSPGVRRWAAPGLRSTLRHRPTCILLTFVAIADFETPSEA